MDRKSELLLLASKRAEERKKIAEANELEFLELVEKFSNELGPIGQAFNVIDCTSVGEGFVVVKLGGEAEFNRYKSSKFELPDQHQFVEPNVVYPAKDKWIAMMAKRGALLMHCVRALSKLYGTDAEVTEGK